MTAPATEPAALDIPEGTAPVRLPVMVVEGMWTADGRFLEPGSLSARTFPIPIYAQDRNSHGSLDGDTSTHLVGAILRASRRPGPEVTQLTTGQPFPEGTFVWEGEGWIYKDVPPPPAKAAYTLINDGALRGNSVDLSEVEAEFEYDEGQDLAADPRPRRIHLNQGIIAATTLVGQPAFPDAYIELDGIAMEMLDTGSALAASAAGDAVPMWRSADVGDVCGPCAGYEMDAPAELLAALYPERDAAFQELLDGDDLDAPEPQPRHTGGMLALVPSNPNMLRVPGGDPAEELHLTLAYLGDNVLDWRPEDRAAVLQIALEATDFRAMRDRLMAEAEANGVDPDPVTAMDKAGRTAAQKGPIEGAIFSHAVFNPNSDNGHDPATVYLLDGTGDRPEIDGLAESLCYRVRDAIGTTQFPEQHRPFVPHVTAGYGVPVENLTYTGPVEFDRLRVAFGDEVMDFPLGGGPMVASAAKLPPEGIFRRPELSGPTPPTVGEMQPWGAPVYGHLACWGTCHIGFAGKCVTPPKSATGYAYFMVHTTRAMTEGGQITDIPVGYGTIGTGHADIRANASATAEHYDNTGTVAFEYAVGEDEHGIWFAGRMLPGLDEAMEHKARGAVFSGDWRNIRGNLELVASLGVNTPGFPVPRVRVASAAPLALVAAGVPQPRAGMDAYEEAWQAKDREFYASMSEVLEYVRDQKDATVRAEVDSALAEILDSTADAEEWEFALAEADLTLAVDGDHPWFTDGPPDKEEGSDDAGWDGFAKRQNWVSKAGGLPKYIKRIQKHLMAKGMAEGQAIATAKNAAARMCKTGDTSLPGKQDINPGSRAEACEAVAEWERKRKGA